MVGQGRNNRAGKVRGHRRGRWRSAAGCDHAGAGEVRDEGWRGGEERVLAISHQPSGRSSRFSEVRPKQKMRQVVSLPHSFLRAFKESGGGRSAGCLLLLVLVLLGLLLDLFLGLIGLLLLVGQFLLGVLIGRRRLHGRSRGTGVGSFRHVAGSLLLGQSLHAIVDLFLEMIVHVLQRVDRDRDLRSRRTIVLLARGDARVDVLILVWSIGKTSDHIAGRERAFAIIRVDRERSRNDEGAARRIERRRHLIFGGGRGVLRLSGVALLGLLLLLFELGLHFFGDRLLDLRSEGNRLGAGLGSATVVVVIR